MPTLNLHSSKGLSKILFKMGGAAAAVGLLACIVFSSRANAATFTLAELDNSTGSVAGFTIGNLEFFDFNPTATTISTDLITIETVDNVLVPGFVVNGNIDPATCDPTCDPYWSVMGDALGFGLPQVLDFSFQVRTVDMQPGIGGATLWASDYSVENGTALALTLADAGLVDLDVLIAEPFGLPITNADLPVDAVNLNPRVASLALSSTMTLDVVGSVGPQGPGSLTTYTMLFPAVSVPEPGTALLMGLGLAGLAVFGRPRR